MEKKKETLAMQESKKEERASKGENQEFTKFRWTKYAPGRVQRI